MRLADDTLEADIARLTAVRRFRKRKDAWAYWGPTSGNDGQHMTTVRRRDFPDSASYQRAYRIARRESGNPIRDSRKDKAARKASDAQ